MRNWLKGLEIERAENREQGRGERRWGCGARQAGCLIGGTVIVSHTVPKCQVKSGIWPRTVVWRSFVTKGLGFSPNSMPA
jgi:hypothetical protein